MRKIKSGGIQIPNLKKFIDKKQKYEVITKISRLSEKLRKKNWKCSSGKGKKYSNLFKAFILTINRLFWLLINTKFFC